MFIFRESLLIKHKTCLYNNIAAVGSILSTAHSDFLPCFIYWFFKGIFEVLFSRQDGHLELEQLVAKFGVVMGFSKCFYSAK